MLGGQEVGPLTTLLPAQARWGAILGGGVLGNVTHSLRTWVAVWLDATSLCQGHLSLRIMSHREPSPADRPSVRQPKASRSAPSPRRS